MTSVLSPNPPKLTFITTSEITAEDTGDYHGKLDIRTINPTDNLIFVLEQRSHSPSSIPISLKTKLNRLILNVQYNSSLLSDFSDPRVTGHFYSLGAAVPTIRAVSPSARIFGIPVRGRDGVAASVLEEIV